MWETVISILQFAFPSGLSLVNIFLLRELWKRNKSRISKDTIDTWHQIANSNNEALANTQRLLADSNEEKLSLKLLLADTNANLKRVERMLDVIAACKYYSGCPVRPELSEYQKLNDLKRNRQPARSRKAKDLSRNNNANGNGDTADSDKCDSDSSGRSCVQRGLGSGSCDSSDDGDRYVSSFDTM